MARMDRSFSSSCRSRSSSAARTRARGEALIRAASASRECTDPFRVREAAARARATPPARACPRARRRPRRLRWWRRRVRRPCPWACPLRACLLTFVNSPRRAAAARAPLPPAAAAPPAVPYEACAPSNGLYSSGSASEWPPPPRTRGSFIPELCVRISTGGLRARRREESPHAAASSGDVGAMRARRSPETRRRRRQRGWTWPESAQVGRASDGRRWRPMDLDSGVVPRRTSRAGHSALSRLRVARRSRWRPTRACHW